MEFLFCRNDVIKNSDLMFQTARNFSQYTDGKITEWIMKTKVADAEKENPHLFGASHKKLKEKGTDLDWI